ncbi:MAG: hypothetical protein G8345_17100 [Magnetococcales bacterium]|nr:hypothetical protein [Magnetococcales bacterium]
MSKQHNTQSLVPDSRRREAGLSFLDRLVVVGGLVAAAIYAVAHFGTPLWEYRVMKDLANTVVNEYARLEESEVNRRVAFELDRNQIKNDDGKFIVVKKDEGGYHVIVEVHIPLTLHVADYTIAEDKEWVLLYEVGK